MIFVDSHCHLDLLAKEQDIANIVARANEQGVKYLQTICTSLDNVSTITQIAARFNNVYASIGLHPNEANVAEQISAENLVNLAAHPKVIGLGETGLDYYHQNYDKTKQQAAFLEHIIASKITDLPVIVHTRDAEVDTAELIVSEMSNGNFKGLIHCFTASKDFAKKMLDQNFYISISGIVTFKNATSLQETVAYLPLNRILIETDAPYLAPIPKRGQTNEPAFVKYVAAQIAQLKNLSLEEVATQTTNNFFALFNKCKR